MFAMGLLINPVKLCLLGGLLLLPFYSYSAEIKIITLGVAPWAYIDEGQDDSVVGTFPQLVAELERRTGHNIKITLAAFSFDRINRELASGRQDCTAVIRSKERDKMTVLGESIMDLSIGILARDTIALKSDKDLHGLKISVVKELPIAHELLINDKLTIELDRTYDEGLRKIIHGRVEAVAGPIHKLQYLAKKQGMVDMLGKPLILSSSSIYLQCARQSKKLAYMDDINQAIRDLKRESVLQTYFTQY